MFSTILVHENADIMYPSLHKAIPISYPGTFVCATTCSANQKEANSNQVSPLTASSSKRTPSPSSCTPPIIQICDEAKCRLLRLLGLSQRQTHQRKAAQELEWDRWLRGQLFRQPPTCGGFGSIRRAHGKNKECSHKNRKEVVLIPCSFKDYAAFSQELMTSD